MNDYMRSEKNQGPYMPCNPDLRHGLDEENPLAAANKDQGRTQGPGPLPAHEHAKITGGNIDTGSGEGVIKNKEATPEGPANPRKLR